MDKVSVTHPEPPVWARRAAHVVALTTLPSGLWRIALALGFHAGYTEQGYAALDADYSLIVLSVVTEAFALLALGLVRPWGEVVPRWVPFRGGRAIRPMVAVVPASIGVVILCVMWTPLLLWWNIDDASMTATGHLIVGFLYLPLVAWAPLLAAVTIDYHRRHRPVQTRTRPSAGAPSERATA